MTSSPLTSSVSLREPPSPEGAGKWNVIYWSGGTFDFIFYFAGKIAWQEKKKQKWQ
jgi:hypothetical protein